MAVARGCSAAWCSRRSNVTRSSSASVTRPSRTWAPPSRSLHLSEPSVGSSLCALPPAPTLQKLQRHDRNLLKRRQDGAGTARAPSAAVSQTPYRAGDLVRIRDQRWRIVGATAHDTHYALRVSGCDSSNAGVSAVFLSPADRIQPLVTSRRPRVVRPARWRRVVRGALAAAVPAFESLRAAAVAAIDLLPFQLEPALAVTRGIGTRLLIADVVGLGKTVQAGLIVAE